MGVLSERRSLFGIFLFCIIFVTCPAWAPASSAEGVMASYGTFSTEVPIAVPAYHGLEPQLKLVYSSSGGNSFAGVGWNISTISAIQRVSASKGFPDFDGTDLFIFDGAEMMPCTSQGGTHCTRTQNYRRIIFDHVNDRWYVYGTNGVKATYEPIYTTVDGTNAWFMTRVEDRHGNAVTYTFWTDGDPIQSVYPASISYNGTTITFYREPRPDALQMGRGNHVGRMTYRLKTIDVQVGGDRARAYELQYDVSTTSGRSLLAGVTQHGRNVDVAADGTITPGVPDMQLPPMTFVYQAGSNGQFDIVYHGVAGPGGRDVGRVLFGDVNGDGRADLVKHDDGGTDVEAQVHTFLATEDGSFTAFYTTVAGPGGKGKGLVRLADVNADGRVDLIKHDNAGSVYTFLALEDGRFDSTYTTTGGPGGNGRGYLLLGDLDGDGRADLLKYDSSGNVYTFLALSDGRFDAAYATHTGPGGDDKDRVALANLNGDPYPDLIKTDGDKNVYTFLSNGDGTFAGTSHVLAPSGGQYATSAFADINGDGLTDVVNYTAYGDLYVYMARGDGTFYDLGHRTYSEFDYNTDYFSFGDINGDGMADLLWGSLDGTVRVHRSNGDGTFTLHGTLRGFESQSFDDLNPLQFADTNGDGSADMIKCDTTGRIFTYLALPDAGSGTFPDLLARFHNGIGGSTRIAYAASSRWKNSYLPAGVLMPTVLALTTDDGRGNAATVSYVYAGGLWSDTERRFLGFRKVTLVQDAQGSYSETYYYQKEGTLSKPEYTYLWDNQGNLYNYSAYRYEDNDAPPYTSVLTELWTYNCGGGDNCLRNLTQFAYDQFANVIETREYGDYDTPGDEKTTVRGYYPNTVDYIHGLPAYENVYAGLGSQGQLMSQTLFYYDDNTSYMSMATRGDLTRARKWNSRTGGYSTVRTQYDAYGNVELAWDERGNQTRAVVYDATYHLYPVEEYNAKNHLTTKTWDTTLGALLTVTDAENGAAVTHTYDELGRPGTESHSEKGRTTYDYGEYSDPETYYIRKTVDDGSAEGLWSETYKDGLGRTYKTVTRGGVTQERWFVGTSERVLEETLPYKAGETVQKVAYTYDALGRVLTAVNPDGTFGRNIYFNDPDGYPVIAAYDETGREKLTWHDAWGRTTAIRDKNGGEYDYTFYEYDTLGNLVRWVDANANVSTATWDSLGRKLSTCTPDTGCWSYTYYDDGLMASQTDAKGQTTHFTYDELGRIETRQLPDMQQVTYFYDEPDHGAGFGRLTRVTYPEGSDSYTYDQRGNTISSTRCIDGTCQTIGKAFDDAGRIEALTYPDGEQITYQYDNQGRLHDIPGYVNNMEWTSDGRLDLMQYANNTTADYGYHPQRRWLTNTTITDPNGNPLYDVGYGYYDSGLVKTVASATDLLANLSYEYDGLNRLTKTTGAQTQTYDYDAMGNRIYAHNSSHPPAVAATADYSYDDNGHLTADGQRVFTWDTRNRLSAVQKGGQTFSFTYDPDGNRTRKSGPQGTTQYFGNLAEMRDGQLVKYYYAGPILVAQRPGSGSIYWYHSDRLGSIQLMTNSSGQIINTYEYAAFGRTLEASGTAANQRGFTGHTGDDEIGLIYMNARYYDPVLGRFISPDSIVPDPGNSQAHNRYAYCYNNPISYVDPSGHEPQAFTFFALAAVAIATQNPTVIGLATAGAVVTTAGYLNNDPMLVSFGMVLTGFAGGYAGLLAEGESAYGQFVASVFVAGAVSPASSFSTGVKNAIQWAYAAYGAIKAGSEFLRRYKMSANAAAIQTDLIDNYTSQLAYPPIEEARCFANHYGMSVDEFYDFLDQAYADAFIREAMTTRPTSWQVRSGHYTSGSRGYFQHRIARWLGGRYNMHVPPTLAGVVSPTGGLVGPGAGEWYFPAFVSDGFLGVHSAVHDAAGLMGSYVTLQTPGLFGFSPLGGQIGGISLQFSRFALNRPLNYIYMTGLYAK